MKQYLNKKTFLNAYFVLFTSCLLYRFINVIFDHSQKEYWGITEWLINYQGGFVRRGLRGEIVFMLNKYLHIEPYIIITIITTVAFLFLVFFFIKGFLKKGYSIFVLPFVFFLGGPILNNYWMRADSIILIIFIIVIYLAFKKPRFYLIWINVFAVLGSLIHEIFIFISFPILITILIGHFQSKNIGFFKSSIITCFSLLPALIAVCSVVYFKGTPHTAYLIWESWKSVEFPQSAMVEMQNMNMGAIAGIGLTIKGGLKIPAEFIRCYDFGLYGPAVLLVTVMAVYFILSNIDKLNDSMLGQKSRQRDNKLLVSKVLLFQFCSTAPLYVIGDDFSRWIYFWVCSSFILLILVPDEKLEMVYPNIVGNISLSINNVFTRISGDSKGLIILSAMIVGFPLYSWNFEGSVVTSSLYVVLSSISSVIKIGLEFLGISI